MCFFCHLLKNANFVKHKKTQLDWHTKRGSRRGPNARLQYKFCKFDFFLFFCVWIVASRKWQEHVAAGCQHVVVPEGVKNQVFFWIFCFNRHFAQMTRTRCRWGPKRGAGRSWAEPSRAEPSRAEPSLAEPSRFSYLAEFCGRSCFLFELVKNNFEMMPYIYRYCSCV